MPPPPAERVVGRGLALLLTIGGLIGLAAAGVLLIEELNILEDPDYVPSCSINPIVSCGSVMTSPQGKAFGFPNPILGLAGFPVVVTTGVAVLAGATFRRWYWRGLQAGVTFGVVFIHWLAYQSLYHIGALCPYCMVVWVVVIPMFLFVTLFNLRVGNLPAPRQVRAAAAKVEEYRGVVLTAWYLAFVFLITRRFWDYWVTLLR